MAEIARAMVDEFAMGSRVGSLFALAGDDASEDTRRVRDEDVRAPADEAFWAATAIIDARRGKLDELAATLLANEVLEREDIDRLMSEVPPAAPSRIGSLTVVAPSAVGPVAGRGML